MADIVLTEEQKLLKQQTLLTALNEAISKLPDWRLNALADQISDGAPAILSTTTEFSTLLRNFCQVHSFNSATILLFCEGKLVLIKLTPPKAQKRETISETGNLKIEGGANADDIDLPSAEFTWEELVNQQLIKWLGFGLSSLIAYTNFATCEYPKEVNAGTLGSPFGILNKELARSSRKRQSHVFVGHVSKQVLGSVTLHKDVESIELLDKKDVVNILRNDLENVSFPHEIGALLTAYYNSMHINIKQNANWHILHELTVDDIAA